MISPTTTGFKPQPYPQLPPQTYLSQMDGTANSAQITLNQLASQNNDIQNLLQDVYTPQQKTAEQSPINTFQLTNSFPAQRSATPPILSPYNQPSGPIPLKEQKILEGLQRRGLVNNADITNTLNIARHNQLDQFIINQALALLGQTQFSWLDLQHMHQLGVQPPFQNGAQALQQIQAKGVRVEFGDMGDSTAHAQWIQEQNLIMINQKYRGDASPATLYAISEAICHEAGHAFGNGDNQSSIQEELNCLALNTLAHRYHKAIDSAYAMTTSTSPLIANGVALYDRLFFDPDSNKQALVNRVVEKYGELSLWSPGHDVPPANIQPLPLAYRVAAQIDVDNVASGKMPLSPALAQSQGLSPPPIPRPQAVAPNLNWVA